MSPGNSARSLASSSTGTYIALLRGINVGGRNKIAMADLSTMFIDAGCSAVRTYIQSGNVVFAADPRLAARIPDTVSAMIAERLGIRSPIVLRGRAELVEVVKHNPFLKTGADPAALHVAFLAEAPVRGRLAALDPDRSPGDSFAARGKDIYLHLPNGVARTKLSNAYFDAALGTTSTMRNWRTVLKLQEMAAESS